MDPKLHKTLCGVVQHIIANDIHIPVVYLRKKWKGPCNPEKHMFTTDKQKGHVAVWALDPCLWETIGNGYCRWMILNDYEKAQFWANMFMSLLRSYEWEYAPLDFKLWLLIKMQLLLISHPNLATIQ